MLIHAITMIVLMTHSQTEAPQAQWRHASEHELTRVERGRLAGEEDSLWARYQLLRLLRR